MAYEATTELAKKQRDLAKARIEAELEQTLATNRRRFGYAGRQQESGFEGRGILRSGEASRGRAELVGEESAAELAARLAAEQQLAAADLTYAQQLAEQQAAGGVTGGGTGAGTGSPATSTIVDTIQPVDPNQQKDAGAPSTGMPSISPEERVKITPSGQGSGQNPNTWTPGQYVSGPDRKLSNGGAVVNGYYIPPGTFGNLAPTPIAPTPPAGGRGTATASPPGKAPAGYTWVRSGNTWKLSKISGGVSGGKVR
jgi:hypothetical protein